jgi:hypothetical protein
VASGSRRGRKRPPCARAPSLRAAPRAGSGSPRSGRRRGAAPGRGYGDKQRGRRGGEVSTLRAKREREGGGREKEREGEGGSG